MKPLVFYTLVISLMFLLNTAHASLIATGNGDVELHINDSNNQLLGAKYLDVFGTGILYDVIFMEGSFNSLAPFNGPHTEFDANTPEAAAAFSQALLDYVFVNFNMNYDALPSLSFGCINSEECLALTPYSLTASIDGVSYAAARNLHSTLDDMVGGGSLLSSDDTANYSDRVWANWQISGTRHELPTDVPEPVSVALLCLGLVGMSYRARKSKKQITL